jgi:putative nucleotidyltransferase with HDIG domain
VWTVLLGLAFVVAATVIALSGTYVRDYTVGEKIDQPVYAKVSFSVEDDQRTRRERQAARAATPSHYRVDYSVIARIESELQALYQIAQAADTFEAFEAETAERGWTVDAPAYETLRSYAESARKNLYEERIARLRKRLVWEYTRRPDAEQDRSPPSSAEIILVHTDAPSNADKQPAPPTEVSIFDVLPISNTTRLQRAASDLALKSGFAAPLRDVVSSILLKQLSESPLLVYDPALTREHMAKRERAVEPVRVHYHKDQPIVPARTEQGLTYADLSLLDKHEEAYRAFLASDEPGAAALNKRHLLRRIGVASVLFLLTVTLFAYVGTYQPRVLQNPTRTAGLAGLLLATLLAACLIEDAAGAKELIVGPPIFAASILAIAYSRRFAFGVMTIASAMLVLSVRGDAGLLVSLLLGVGATVWLLDEIRTRTRLIWVGVVSANMIFASITAIGLVDGQALSFAAVRGARGAAVAFVASLFLQATLPLIERIFGIVTSLTLLEWRDPTRPLLQRLARDAPGTYAHSLALGTLADAACRAIGADGLLAQVGALYHDVGKLHKSAYFAENQEASINRHDHLAPTMSLLIIIGHVKDGLEMAREYKLPRVLHQFIQEHHGTTVVKYFHHIASEQQPQIARGRHDRQVPEAQFRYPGPKPRSKESAVLMLCDGTESAVRSLSDPTPGRIENVVHQIVMDRLKDGQFDDCEITLRELHQVEESLAKNLCSYYHGRIAYPKSKEKEERPQEPETHREVVGKSIAG